MIKVAHFTSRGERKPDLKVNIREGSYDLRPALISQAILVERNRLAGAFAKAKTRAQVSGGGRKPWRQKGTGKARAGSIRSPLFKGGGVIFGPTGEKKTLRLPKKMKEAALCQLLAGKLRGGDVAVIDTLKVESGKTKDAQKVLDKIAPGSKSILLAVAKELGDFVAWRNLIAVECKEVTRVLLQDLTKKGKFIFSESAFRGIKSKLEDD